MSTINSLKNKKYPVIYLLIIVGFLVVGLLVPDVYEIREEVSFATREEIREEITAEVTEYMLYEDPYATQEDILYAVVEAIEEEVAAAVTDALSAALGLWVLVPAAFLITYIMITKRIIEGLALSLVLGVIVGYKGDFFAALNDIMFETQVGEDLVWLILVCGMMSGFVCLLEKTGGGFAFARLAARIAKTARPTLITTALCSLLLSLDDYLAILTTGSAMTPVNDRNKTPREMTAYVIDAMGAPASGLNPISTWGAFIGLMLVSNGLGESGGEILSFLQVLPFTFYPMATMIVLILVLAGIIPAIGPMRGAYKRVAQGGPLAPPGSERYDIRQGGDADIETPENPKLYNFFVPIFVLIGTTIFFEFDLMMGVIATLGFCFVFFVFQGILGPMEFVDELIRGIKNLAMIFVFCLLGFSFAALVNEIGFVQFFIELAVQNLTAPILAPVLFIVLAAVAFVTAEDWGLYIIALPIAIPVAIHMGVNPYFAASAVVSAGILGSHAAFFSDSTMITSAATGCDTFRHGITQLPYVIIGVVLTTIAYFVAGFVMYG